MSPQNSKTPCNKKPCNRRDFETSTTDDPNAELTGRPLLFTGVLWIQVMRRFLLPRRDEPCDLMPPPAERPRPEDLSEPINVSHIPSTASPAAFDSPQIHQSPLKPTIARHETKHWDQSSLKHPEDGEKNRPSQIAELLYQAQDQVRQVNKRLNDFIEEGKAATTGTVGAIRQEDAVVYRYGVITLSGLVGYLLGLHRGVIPRILYSATGVTAAAAICYPRETVAHNQQGLNIVHQCVVFGIELFLSKPPFSQKDETNDYNETNDPKSMKHSNSVSKHTKEVAALQSDQHKNKLTKDSFIHQENDFKDYQNYHDQFKPKPNEEIFHNLEKIESVEGQDEPGEKYSQLQSSKPHPTTPPPPPKNLKDRNLDLTQRGGANTKTSFQPVRSQPTETPDLPHPPRLSPHMRNDSQEVFVLTPNDSVLLPPKSAEDSTSKSNAQFSKDITPKHEGLAKSDDKVPESNLKSDVIENSGKKDENNSKYQYNPLNKKLSRYYKQSLENKPSSAIGDDTSPKID